MLSFNKSVTDLLMRRPMVILFIGLPGSPREVTKTCFVLSLLHTIAFCPLSINLLWAAMPYISNHLIKKRQFDNI